MKKDEIIGEFIGYDNQFVLTTKYIFENDKAIACYNEAKSDDEIFLETFLLEDGTTKNIKRKDNVVTYEWNDDFFKQKGKGCSKKEIINFLKESGYKIIKKEL